MNQHTKFPSRRLFGIRQIITYTLVFLVTAFFAQRSVRYVCTNVTEFDCAYYFPISIFQPRLPSLTNLLIALLTSAFFFLSYRIISRSGFRLRETILIGFLLVCGTTLTQGFVVGFYSPLAGDSRSGVLIPYSLDGQEYYHDAIKIKDPLHFFTHYNEIQPTLSMHGYTHPPGATMLFYTFSKIFGNPGSIAIFIGFVSIMLSALGVYLNLKRDLSEENSRYFAYLFVLLPVVHIYYIATIDALISSIIILTLYTFRHKNPYFALPATIFLLLISQLLTFVSLFILPVLVGFEIIQRRTLIRSFISIGSVALILSGIWAVAGYNHFEAFQTASAYENPKGFMGFVEPINYFFTRIEDVGEILVFLGPFLIVLLVKSLKGFKLKENDLSLLSVLGVFTLLMMFAAGTFRTGETARACAFIFAFLLFPIAIYFGKNEITSNDKRMLAFLVFAQSLGMQLFGFYLW